MDLVNLILIVYVMLDGLERIVMNMLVQVHLLALEMEIVPELISAIVIQVGLI
jgi:hypothetical protein